MKLRTRSALTYMNEKAFLFRNNLQFGGPGSARFYFVALIQTV